MSYRFTYDETGIYGHVVALVREHAVGVELHLDIGCGWGAIAEPLRDAGFTYVGFDIDAEAVAGLRSRGFEAHVIDLGDPVSAQQVITEAIQGRPVSSMTIIDTLEHITTDAQVLTALRGIAVSAEPIPLVVSVPNVSHRDVAAKLLTGRWDYTETGLLDHTHFRFFAAAGLQQMMGRAGWAEVAQHDFHQPVSDQHFPQTSVALSDSSALGALLRTVRDASTYGSTVNQFVRAYLPARVKAGAPWVDRVDESEWPLTVLVRTQGRRPHTLRDTLLCLLAQTVDTFEVIVLAHDVSTEEQIGVEQAVQELPTSLRDRTRVLAVHGGGRARPLNRGVEASRGEYIAVLDDDDTVFAHWVETFIELATHRPGRLCRTVAVSQPISVASWSDGRPGFHTEGGVEREFPVTFDLFSHLGINRTPFMCWAFPRALFTELGVRFDETLSVCEDWDVILRGAFICGVSSSPETTANYRRWQDGDASHLVHEREDWQSDAERIIGRLNQQSTVLAPGSIRRLRDLIRVEEHNRAVTGQRDQLLIQRSAWEAERAQMVQDYVDRGGELITAWQANDRLQETIDHLVASRAWRASAKVRRCIDGSRVALARAVEFERRVRGWLRR